MHKLVHQRKPKTIDAVVTEGQRDYWFGIEPQRRPVNSHTRQRLDDDEPYPAFCKDFGNVPRFLAEGSELTKFVLCLIEHCGRELRGWNQLSKLSCPKAPCLFR